MFPKKGNKLHWSGQSESADVDFPRAIATALQSNLGTTHQAVKTMMRWTGACERSAKHWLAGTHGPSGEHLARLAKHSDEVLMVFLKLAGRQRIIKDLRRAEAKEYLLAALACFEDAE